MFRKFSRRFSALGLLPRAASGRLLSAIVILFLPLGPAEAPPRAERIVVLKTDGLPYESLDYFVRRKDPRTGKSVLPWIDEVFYRRGARIENFYSRGLSLSAPSWAMLDTGQPSVIKGNMEFDRLTLEPYDYLSLLPHVLKNAVGSENAKTRGTQVLDEQSLPLLSDAYAAQERHVSMQIFARGLSTGLSNAKHLLTLQSPKAWLDEWTIGLEGDELLFEVLERELTSRLSDTRFRYLDFLIPAYDHTAHVNREPEALLGALQQIDQAVGRVWTAIEKSPLANHTVLILVSDHGMNTDPAIYSQGYNLVNLFTSAAGGGHHVVTNRAPLGEFALKPPKPIPAPFTTVSAASLYLKGQSGKFPTLLLDADGNERASVYLRHSDLNVLQILWQELARKDLAPDIRRAASRALFETLDRNRPTWEELQSQLQEELAASGRRIQRLENMTRRQPQSAKTLASELASMKEDFTRYHAFVDRFAKLLALRPETFDPSRLKPDKTMPEKFLGPLNSIHHLQNYVVGLSSTGLVLDRNGSLDPQRSFQRVNYLEMLSVIRAQNSPQPSVSARPVDFTAIPVPVKALEEALPPELAPIHNAVWLYKDDARQALILSRNRADGRVLLRYVPVSRLTQTEDGAIQLARAEWQTDLPLAVWEDLQEPGANRRAWLENWHDEPEWLMATHAGRYSNAVIDLYEQFSSSTPSFNFSRERWDDDELIRRFQQRKRAMTQADFIVFAEDHWNFNYRGFNPGGNHGAFFRKSTRATLMFAGGKDTGIPQGLAVDHPYDTLSFAPTMFRLTGQLTDQGISANLRAKGFKEFPGKAIEEVLGPAAPRR